MNLASLRQVAEAATPGPWHVDQDERPGMKWNRSIATASGDEWVCIMTHNGGLDRKREEATAAHIAAMNPQVALALIAVAEAAKALQEDAGNRPWSALRAALAVLEKME